MGITKDHLGVEFDSVEEKSKAWGIPVELYLSRISRGWSERDALTIGSSEKARQPVYDHLHNEYPSIRAMCKAYGVRESTFSKRRSRGRSLQESLMPERLVRKDAKPKVACKNTRICYDPSGREFPNRSEMCKFWHMDYFIYQARISRGWDEQKALITPVKPHMCCDHLGNQFSTAKEMCKHWGVSYTTFISRRSRGWSIERALTDVSDRAKVC